MRLRRLARLPKRSSNQASPWEDTVDRSKMPVNPWRHGASVSENCCHPPVSNWLRITLVMLLAAGASLTFDSFANEAPAQAVGQFVGKYTGVSVEDPLGILTPEDLDVLIRQTPTGFQASWHSAVIEQGHPERSHHTVRFDRTRAPEVFRAHGAPGMTGSLQIPDPIDGEPYFWARISSDTLLIYVLHILPDGSLDLRIYARSQVAGGQRMRLEFTRLRDGRTIEIAVGELVRSPE